MGPDVLIKDKNINVNQLIGKVCVECNSIYRRQILYYTRDDGVIQIERIITCDCQLVKIYDVQLISRLSRFNKERLKIFKKRRGHEKA